MKHLILFSMILLMAACQNSKPNVEPPKTLSLDQILAYKYSGKGYRCDSHSLVDIYVIKDSRFKDSLVYFRNDNYEFEFLDYKISDNCHVDSLVFVGNKFYTSKP